MSADEKDKHRVGKSRVRPMRWVVASVVLLAVWVGVVMHFPPARFVLWSLGEIVIPAWEAIDPTVPRPGRLPDDFANLKDADAKGKALRVAVDKFYGTLPETGNSWLREVFAPPYAAGYAIDISKIARHYIPEGTSFDEAERILLAAGMTIVLPRMLYSAPGPLEPKRNLPLFTVRAALEQHTKDPPAYMRLYINLPPKITGDYGDGSPVGKVTALLNRQLGAPIPPVSFPLDVGNASAVLDVSIKIVEQRFYQFELVFSPLRPADRSVVARLVGDPYSGEANVDRRYRHDFGVVIPLRVVVANERQQIVYDRTIDTKGFRSSSYRGKSRMAGGVNLAPGFYNIRVSTTEDIPAFSDAKIDFSVTYDVRL
jgi:hypothetical protein